MPIIYIKKGKRGPKPKLPLGQRQQMIADHLAGAMPTALSIKYGVCTHTVARYVRGHKRGSAVTAPPDNAAA